MSQPRYDLADQILAHCRPILAKVLGLGAAKHSESPFESKQGEAVHLQKAARHILSDLLGEKCNGDDIDHLWHGLTQVAIVVAKRREQSCRTTRATS